MLWWAIDYFSSKTTTRVQTSDTSYSWSHEWNEGIHSSSVTRPPLLTRRMTHSPPLHTSCNTKWCWRWWQTGRPDERKYCCTRRSRDQNHSFNRTLSSERTKTSWEPQQLRLTAAGGCRWLNHWSSVVYHRLTLEQEVMLASSLASYWCTNQLYEVAWTRSALKCFHGILKSRHMQ